LSLGQLYFDVTFDNGEEKKFDVKPYIKGEWYGQLKDATYFKDVSTDVYTAHLTPWAGYLFRRAI